MIALSLSLSLGGRSSGVQSFALTPPPKGSCPRDFSSKTRDFHQKRANPRGQLWDVECGKHRKINNPWCDNPKETKNDKKVIIYDSCRLHSWSQNTLRKCCVTSAELTSAEALGETGLGARLKLPWNPQRSPECYRNCQGPSFPQLFRLGFRTLEVLKDSFALLLCFNLGIQLNFSHVCFVVSGQRSPSMTSCGRTTENMC